MLAERIDQWNREILEKGRPRRGSASATQLEVRPPLFEERVRAAHPDRLLEWSERILTAERLEDLFGE